MAFVTANNKKKTKKKVAAKKKPAKKNVVKKKSKTRHKKKRINRPFPRATIESAQKIPFAIKEKNGGKPWSPNEIAKVVGLAVKGTPFFNMTAASRDFGLTTGSRDSKEIALTETGRKLVYAPSKQVEKSTLRSAFFEIVLFKEVFEYYNGPELPELGYLGNVLVDKFGLDIALHEEFRDLFIENCKYLELDNREGARRGKGSRDPSASSTDTVSSFVIIGEPDQLTGTCFVAIPFKEREPSHPPNFFEEVLESLISPAGKAAGFRVVTARREGSDVIQATIVNNLLNAELVIADLTENNPNVLFELGLRIAEDKPVALIRAKGTPPIFDVDNMLRVFEYDPNLWTSTIENDIPKLKSHIEAAWGNRDDDKSYMKILRGSYITS
jgi:hypothetical protein